MCRKRERARQRARTAPRLHAKLDFQESSRDFMSPPGRPKGEYRSAQREGSVNRPPGRPKGEYRSAQREGNPMSAQADTHALTALSPLDGRYAGKVAALAAQFSEYGLIRHRVRVELAWLAALADESALGEIAPFSKAARGAIDYQHCKWFCDPPVSSSDQAATGATSGAGLQQACHCRQTERTRSRLRARRASRGVRPSCLRHAR